MEYQPRYPKLIALQTAWKEIKWQAWSFFKMFDTLMVFLKEFFEKVNFEKN